MGVGASTIIHNTLDDELQVLWNWGVWINWTGSLHSRLPLCVSKHINILRKLKFKINRSNLEKLYLFYIRPIFEYASEVWDNCGSVNVRKLERLQLEAVRIVTGLPVFANSNFIFRELGWETFSPVDIRQKRRDLEQIATEGFLGSSWSWECPH